MQDKAEKIAMKPEEKTKPTSGQQNNKKDGDGDQDLMEINPLEDNKHNEPEAILRIESKKQMPDKSKAPNTDKLVEDRPIVKTGMKIII